MKLLLIYKKKKDKTWESVLGLLGIYIKQCKIEINLESAPNGGKRDKT
jgi:hypothetical protein